MRGHFRIRELRLPSVLAELAEARPLLGQRQHSNPAPWARQTSPQPAVALTSAVLVRELARARTGSLCYAGMLQWLNTSALSSTHMHYVATAVTLQDMLRGRSCYKWQNSSTHNSGHVGLMTFTLQELLRCKICFVTGAITNITALSLKVVTTLT
jgi:hypothetical protein